MALRISSWKRQSELARYDSQGSIHSKTTQSLDSSSGSSSNIAEPENEENSSNDPNQFIGRLPSGDCSCFNPHASPQCCERTVRRSHRMGFGLTQELFLQQKIQSNTASSSSSSLYQAQNIKVVKFFRSAPPHPKTGASDYRDVIFVRNIYDSLVSGYLYHRTGRECHLDPKGRPTPPAYQKGALFNRDWGRYFLTLRADQYPPDPPIHDRSFCDYLAQVPEEAGMRVLIEVFFKRWYNDLLENVDYANNQIELDLHRTHLLCYADLLRDRQGVMNRGMEFLFPQPFSADNKEPSTQEQPSEDENEANKYKGVNEDNRHRKLATSLTDSDPDRDARLRQLIQKLDREVFDNLVANAQAKLNCPEYEDTDVNSSSAAAEVASVTGGEEEEDEASISSVDKANDESLAVTRKKSKKKSSSKKNPPKKKKNSV